MKPSFRDGSRRPRREFPEAQDGLGKSDGVGPQYELFQRTFTADSGKPDASMHHG
jgi:hypothetical protein